MTARQTARAASLRPPSRDQPQAPPARVPGVEWVLLFAGLALAGAVVLGIISWGFWRKVRALGSEVSRASNRLAEVQTDLAAAAAELQDRQSGQSS